MGSDNTENYSLNQNITMGCGCAACESGQESTANTYAYESNLDNDNQPLDAPDSSAPATAGTKEQFGQYLTDGYFQEQYADYYNDNSWLTKNFDGWQDTNITFSIANTYSANEKAGIRDAFETWSDITNVNFTEVGSSGGEISFEAPGGGETGRAFAQSTVNSPNGQDWYIISSRIVIDYDSGGFGSNPSDLGDYALTTAIHEIGHAIGLGHSGYYNAGDGNPTYNNDAQWTNDTRQFSLMSYWGASNSGANHLGEFPSTPMVMDIYAIQSLYGANNSIRSGDTTYGFNSNAGRDQFDFTVNTAPVVAIWDGGGNDTIDLSSWGMYQTINLNDGEFSNVGGGTGNLAIAYNAAIENAVGGFGRDDIYGNEFNNSISGGNGNDVIYGSAANDTISGDIGTDRVIYSYDFSDFVASMVNGTTVALQNIAEGWTDTITTVEEFLFNGTLMTWAQVTSATDVTASMMAQITIGADKFKFYSNDGADNILINAAELSYGGASGNMFRMERTDNTLDFHVLNTSAPNRVYIDGDDATGDTINMLGTHANMIIGFTGQDGNDTFTIATGIIGNDLLFGGGGNDILRSSSGNDRLYGDEGNDTLYGENGNDDLHGGLGDDWLYGDLGDDRLFGNEGNDRLYTGDGNNVARGGDGDDIIVAGSGNDILSGNDGYDNISGGDGRDYIYGDAGQDNLKGDGGDDLIYGGFGNDVINGGTGNDKLFGQEDADRIHGGEGNDLIRGGAGHDILRGGSGIDDVRGGNGDDNIMGQDDNDYIEGNLGNDHIQGGNGDDIIRGGDGDDILIGDEYNNGIAGNDLIYGGNGNDLIVVDQGSDRLYGNDGADTFVFYAVSYLDGFDQIRDFNVGQGDALDISDVLNGFYNSGSDDINDFLQFGDNGTHTYIRVDQNGGGDNFTQIAMLNNASGLNTLEQLITDGNLIV